jgi:hypothetical protein
LNLARGGVLTLEIFSSRAEPHRSNRGRSRVLLGLCYRFPSGSAAIHCKASENEPAKVREKLPGICVPTTASAWVLGPLTLEMFSSRAEPHRSNRGHSRVLLGLCYRFPSGSAAIHCKASENEPAIREEATWSLCSNYRFRVGPRSAAQSTPPRYTPGDLARGARAKAQPRPSPS